MTQSDRVSSPGHHTTRLARSLVVLTLGFGVAALPAHADPIESGLAFAVGDPRITASSGLTRDTTRNVFWTVNADDPAGVAYAVGPDGRTRGTLQFGGSLVDAEAVAYAGGRLFIADIGDEDVSRQSVRVFEFADPAPNQQRGSDFTAYELVYPDGPHDAGAVLVDAGGQLRIVTRAAEGAVYRAPARLQTDAPNRLTRVADAPAFVTDATVLPSGRYAMRTYVGVHVMEPELYAPVAESPLPYQPMGESMTVSMSDTALLIGSVGEQSRVLRVPVPQELEDVPVGPAVPPPSPPPEAAPDEASTQSSPTNRSGTLIALLFAFVVAVAAGVVVYRRDRTGAVGAEPTPRRGLPGDDGTKP